MNAQTAILFRLGSKIYDTAFPPSVTPLNLGRYTIHKEYRYRD